MPKPKANSRSSQRQPNHTASSHEPKSHPALLFDLDGTLIDSSYCHVLAWQEALEKGGIEIPAWRIHRRIGMSGGLFVNALLHEIEKKVDPARVKRFGKWHDQAYLRRISQVRLLPGSKQLLKLLSRIRVPWAIATSGYWKATAPMLKLLGVPRRAVVITRDDVARAKPDPDLFIAAAERLGVSIADCIVVGNSVWDMLAARRAHALGVGVLTGGLGEDELERSGAYRVYSDPLDLLNHLDELGIRYSRDN
jgi:HAD superfamily hydrolase (TIGR01509 family)